MPPGFRYAPELIGRAEEAQLLAAFEALPFVPFEFRGYTGRRAVIYFGWRYDFNAGRIGEAEAIPDFLLPLRAKVAAFAGGSPPTPSGTSSSIATRPAPV